MKKLLDIDLYLYIFALIGLRIVGLGAGIGDAIALTALVSLYGYKEYLKSKEVPPLDDQVRNELDAMKASISSLSIKQMPKTPPIGNKKFF